MIKELEGFEEGPKAKIHIDLLKTTSANISNWKTPGHDGVQGFWFKKFTSIHYILSLEMNKKHTYLNGRPERSPQGNLKRETESLLIAAQHNAIRTNNIKARID